ncbi:hypothetical protein [Brachybacterium sp.]|uniref:hypothetical protein n=1 Tax=Brachybacterium sp. TaxID=1891286 RepID=UPI002ED47F81
MTHTREDRARTAQSSACPDRLRTRDETVPLLDLILALLAMGIALAIITDPPGGPIDGRHLLAGAALTALLIRTTRAARR